MAAPLKLRACDADDLQVIAAVLQDALVPLRNVAYQRRQRRFVLVANRFRWEGPPVEEAADEAESAVSPEARGQDAPFAEQAREHLYERVNCGVRVNEVVGVRCRGLDFRERDQILNLLTVEAAPDAVTLLFSGGGAIRLEVAAIDCRLEDIGEPWPTRWRPSHPLDAADLGG